MFEINTYKFNVFDGTHNLTEHRFSDHGPTYVIMPKKLTEHVLDKLWKEREFVVFQLGVIIFVHGQDSHFYSSNSVSRTYQTTCYTDYINRVYRDIVSGQFSHAPSLRDHYAADSQVELGKS